MRNVVVTLIVVAAGTLGVTWFLATHERVEEQEFVGYRGLARVNEFLAAEYLLEELGYAAFSEPTLVPSDWLPPVDDTIVKRVSADAAIGEERDRLFDWIQGGGHLVLLPPRRNDALVEDFLDYLGVDFRPVQPSEQAELPDGAVDIHDLDDIYSALSADYSEFRIVPRYEDMFDTTLTDEHGIIAARTDWGDGFLTLVSDMRYFANRTIGRGENAGMMLDVVAGFIEPGQIWFVYDASFPSLWAIIWNNAAFAVVCAGLALALWIWAAAPRFGPAIPAADEPRRSIIEHIQAAGVFAWRNRGAAVLAGSSISALLHDAEARHPGIGRMSRTEQAKRIARITNLPEERVFDALAVHDNPRPRDFTEQMQDLQVIRKEL